MTNLPILRKPSDYELALKQAERLYLSSDLSILECDLKARLTALGLKNTAQLTQAVEELTRIAPSGKSEYYRILSTYVNEVNQLIEKGVNQL